MFVVVALFVGVVSWTFQVVTKLWQRHAVAKSSLFWGDA